MATTTIRLSIGSQDLTSDPFAISSGFNVTSDGSAGLDLTTGLARKKIGTSAEILLDASTFSNTGESQLAYVFIKNLSSNLSSVVFTDSIKIDVSDGTNHNVLGYLAGGQSIILPFSADNDIRVTADTLNTVIEYVLVHAG